MVLHYRKDGHSLPGYLRLEMHKPNSCSAGLGLIQAGSQNLRESWECAQHLLSTGFKGRVA